MPQNAVTIAGNLTNDPELRYTPTGQPVARFTVAYSERYRDTTSGEWKEGDTSFFTAYAWNDLGEHVAETFIRGDRVIVTGAMRQRSWETKEGEKRYTVEIRADDVGASVRFATAVISKVMRNRDPGPDPWASASRTRPAEPGQKPAPEPGPEPAPDGPQEPAEPPAEPSGGNGSESPAPRRSRARK